MWRSNAGVRRGSRVWAHAGGGCMSWIVRARSYVGDATSRLVHLHFTQTESVFS